MRNDRPLEIAIPRPDDERPGWSRVGIVGAIGFIVGVAWPRVVGVRLGPSAPGEHGGGAEVTAPVKASAQATASAAPEPSASAAAEAANKEIVVVAAGRIIKCSDKRERKVDDCEKLQFDPVAVPRLKELAACPAAVGFEGKVPIGFEVDFEKKEVHVTKGKKASVPASTLQGILQCAAHSFASASLDDVPHNHRRYTLAYALTFYPPGKNPEEAPGDKAQGDEGGSDEAAGATTSEAPISGTATVTWDTALVRKEPKDGEVVARLVRGTKVKLLARQNDWYRVDTGSKQGWVYRGSVGL